MPTRDPKPEGDTLPQPDTPLPRPARTTDPRIDERVQPGSGDQDIDTAGTEADVNDASVLDARDAAAKGRERPDPTP